MNKQRQRILQARAHRQESLHPKNVITVEKTIDLPQPKNFNKDIDRKFKTPVVTEIAKRGRGRPPKAVSEKINSKKQLTGNTVKGKGKK